MQLYLGEFQTRRFDWSAGIDELDSEVLFITGERSTDLGTAFQQP